MSILVAGALIFLLIFIFLIAITVSLLGLIVTLAVAFVVGWAADKVVPGALPFGWIGAIAAGLLGSWLGGALLDDFGPAIGGIALIPAFVGAVILALIASAIFHQRSPAR